MNSIALQSMFDPISDCPQEASELETRADLMISIRDIINDKGWTLKETAQIFGLTQIRVNDLKEGRIEKFSIGLLMACLYRAGFRFQTRYENHTLIMNVQFVG